jgi:hypothetical protein
MLDEIDPDAHNAFNDASTPAQPPPRQDPEERRRLIAALAAQ